MGGTTSNGVDVDGVVDRFVEAFNRAPRERQRAEDVPLELRDGEPDFTGRFFWLIRPSSNPNAWISRIEDAFGHRLPPTFRSLVTRHRFPAFECGPLRLLASTGQPLYDEWISVLERNPEVRRLLDRTGFLQFARPLTGESDPVCFDYGHRRNGEEPRIVRLDHTSLLSGSSPVILEELAGSLRDIVEGWTPNGLSASVG